MNATLTLFDLAPTVAPSGESAEGGTGGQQRTPDAAPGAAPNVRASDPDTSHIAAASVERERIGSLVRRLLTEYPDGLSDWELFRLSGLPEHLRGSLIKQRGESGAVDTGRRNWSPSRRKVAVWALPEVES